MSLPIIFIHTGNASYLWFSLRQARIFHPDSEIILLGDSENRHFPFISHHHNLSDFFEGAGLFASVYQHLSVNKLEFERFCFQRWFVLRDFMRREKIEQCFLMDSDVMLYCNVDQESGNFASHDMTLSHAQTPGNVFINRRFAIETLCEFLLEMYRDPSQLTMLRQRFEDSGVVSDMTALVDFSHANLVDIGDTRKIINGTTWDDNVNCSSGFEMRQGIKKFLWRGNLPYALTETGERIKFHAIHFQGSAKKRMARFASQFDLGCLKTLIRSRSTEKVERYLNSLKKRLKKNVKNKAA